MRVSLEWLGEWVGLARSGGALAEQLTMAGFEVEARWPAAPPFSGVWVGEVLETQRHPEAARLSVCTVAAGGAARPTGGCGAGNGRAGPKTPLAPGGAGAPAGG